MADSSPALERIRQTIEWGPGEGLRAVKRIKRNMDQVLELCFKHGLSLVDVAKVNGAPGLRTMRRWESENLYDFSKRYKKIRVSQRMQRYLDSSKEFDRQEAEANGPRALARYEHVQKMIFLQAFQELEDEEGDPRFTAQQRGILNLCRQGWSFKRIEAYCNRFGVDLEAPEES
jgi:hypothetical protein